MITEQMVNDELVHRGFVLKEMNKRRKEALQSLSPLVHPEYLEPMAKIFAWACLEEDNEALSIMHRFKLSQGDVLAIAGDYRRYDEYTSESYV